MFRSEWTEKSAGAWEIQGLTEREGAEEGPYLEFKKVSEFVDNGRFSKDKFCKEVAETVSAFLNSDGGVLLIGVQTNKDASDKKKETMKSLAEWGSEQTFARHEVSFTESQVKDIIYSNVLPKPFGTEVKALNVPVPGGPASVFVVTVPASTQGAHQSARTKVYYKRTCDGDIPMLDYEIRDVNSRREGPLLHLACALLGANGSLTEDDWKTSSVQADSAESPSGSLLRVTFVFSVSNLGRGTANIARFDVGIPEPWKLDSYSPEGTNAGVHWEAHSALRYLLGDTVTIFWMPGKGPTSFRQRVTGERLSGQQVEWQVAINNGNEPPAHPIWPAAGRIVIGALGLRIQARVDLDTFWWIPWRALAEGMPETRGGVMLEGRNRAFRMSNRDFDEVSWWGHGEEIRKFNDLKQRFEIP